MKELAKDIKQVDPDLAHSIWKAGHNEGVLHRSPSPETRTQLDSIKGNMQNIETHLEYIKGSLEENKEEHREIFEFLKDDREKADAKYARIEDVKRIEGVIEKQESLVNKILWTSVTSLIGFLITIIMQLLGALL